jgi:hypothetical protein
MEFFSVINSNAVWAYSDIVPRMLKGLVRVMGYIVIPLIIVFFFGILCFFKWCNKLAVKQETWFILTFLFLAFVLNFHRGLVRHSMSELSFRTTYWTAIPFICIAFSFFLKKYQKVICIFFLSSICFFIGFIRNNADAGQISGILNEAIPAILYKDTLSIERQVSNDTTAVYSNLKRMFDSTLKNGESYIDFTNQTLLYALMDYEKPVYINQSPGLLNNEASQKYYVHTLMQKNVYLPFAILPTKKKLNFSTEIDGLLNSYRYYLVAEYIYTHYSPLVVIDSFVFWCRNDMVQETLRKINNTSFLLPYMPIGKDYYKTEILHDYNIGSIAWLWGMFDNHKAWDNKISQNLFFDDNGYAEIEQKSINKKHGNYLDIVISAHEEGNASVELTQLSVADNTEIPSTVFRFKIMAGEHIRYLIRISSDFNWYFSELDTLRIKTTNTISIVSAKILERELIEL